MTARHQNLLSHKTLRIAESTFAQMPSASRREQQLWRATDVGAAGAIMRSNGSYWKPLNGRATLDRSAIPVGIAPTIAANASGTANGASTWASGCFPITAFQGYLYYPLNSLHASQAAGFYWTVVTSTTAFTAYNNTYTVGTAPTVPTTLTAFSGAVPGGTGVTTEVDVFSTSIEAGIMNLDGGVAYSIGLITKNHADAKTLNVYFGGTAVATLVYTTATGDHITGGVSNIGSAAKQVAVVSSDGSTITTNMAYTTINTAADATFKISLTAGTATAGSLVAFATVDLVG